MPAARRKARRGIDFKIVTMMETLYTQSGRRFVASRDPITHKASLESLYLADRSPHIPVAFSEEFVATRRSEVEAQLGVRLFIEAELYS